MDYLPPEESYITIKLYYDKNKKQILENQEDDDDDSDGDSLFIKIILIAMAFLVGCTICCAILRRC